VTGTPSASADPASAARLVLESLGVSLADLQRTEETAAKATPTFRENVPRFASGVPASSRQLLPRAVTA
jgi:hypothetical protein